MFLHLLLLAQTFTKTSQIVNLVNAHRVLHNSPTIQWNTTLAGEAYQWASYLIRNNKFEHRNNDGKGTILELIYLPHHEINSTPHSWQFTSQFIYKWYQEIDNFKFQDPHINMYTASFTCLVWKNVESFGIGIARNKESIIIVYMTFPPCNIHHQLEGNVMPSTNTSTKTIMLRKLYFVWKFIVKKLNIFQF